MKTKTMIIASKGKFLTVEFITKQGYIRTLNGRTGVTYCLKGNGRAKSLKDKTLKVWCNKARQYRSIRPESIVRVASKHEVHSWK